MVERLQQFSKRHDATLFMTVLAAFAVVLHRLTAQDEIVIGTPVANRGSPELEQIVGPFVNSLSLRLSIEGNPSFASYLAQVRRATIEAIDNRESTVRHGGRGDKSRAHARPRADLPSDVRAA